MLIGSRSGRCRHSVRSPFDACGTSLSEPDVLSTGLRGSVAQVRSVLVEGFARAGCGAKLSVSLGYGPGTARPVDCHSGPAAPVLIADVDEQRVVVVLDPDAMARVVSFAQDSGLACAPGCDCQE
jgi:hypothetical protein